MKRIRRITMEVIQRRQQMSLHGDAALPTPVSAQPGAHADAGRCPLCGSPRIPVPDRAPGASTLSELETALSSLHLHLQTAPDGRLWICLCRHDRLKENQ